MSPSSKLIPQAGRNGNIGSTEPKKNGDSNLSRMLANHNNTRHCLQPKYDYY